MRLHETHVCRSCGCEITLPYAKPDESLEGYWEKAYWRLVPMLVAALARGVADRRVKDDPLIPQWEERRGRPTG